MSIFSIFDKKKLKFTKAYANLIHYLFICFVFVRYIYYSKTLYMMRSISVSGARVWKEVLESNIHRKMNEKLVYSERWGKNNERNEN